MNSSIARDRISSVVRPDSIAAAQGDFLATHVAIKRIHLLTKFDIAPANGKDYSEDTVYKRFVLNPDNRHQFIAVYGQSGTGKSHLIRWFEAKYRYDKPENEVVLFIRRSDNTLKGTIRQLLATPEVQEIANKEVYDRLAKATVYEDENKLKGRIYHDFINEIEFDDDSHAIKLTSVKRKRLTAFLYNEVVQSHLMSPDGPLERIYSKVAENSIVDRDTIAQFQPEDFLVTADLFEDIHRAGADPKAEKMAREFMSDDSGFEAAKKAADYLNQFVNDVIQRCAGIEAGDFRDIFQDIRRELFRIGKNLTLFIEDVTSFTGVDDALLDALIVEHTGMNAGEDLCRISSIVGTTSNYLQNNFRDNHKDRITQYIYIPSDVFDENGIFEFVGRYLNAMSLPEATIAEWMKHHAAPSEYPIHELEEGSNWEFVSAGFGKELCLYPFTKNSIRYIYKYGLTKGHQTPRYIIRDIIEPVVSDILNNKETFPSIKYNMVSVDTNLSMLIHNQIKDEKQADRMLRFLRIWGDGSPDQYTQDGKVYIASIRKEILDELGFPEISLADRGPAEPKGETSEKDPKEIENTGKSNEVGVIPEKALDRVSKANDALSSWVNGQQIDASANVGTSGVLRAAQGDICDFLVSSINWQAEGISSDNMAKIKASSVRLVIFENQTKKTAGFYVLPASWETMNVISAFIRWREYGASSWKYPDSDLDAYVVTSWAYRITPILVKAVSEYTVSQTSYVDAAIAAEMLRMILCGEYREKSLKNMTVKYLFESKPARGSKTSHAKEWNSLVSLLSQKGADSTNKETVRQYFNIPQGSGGSILVLDEPNLMRTFHRVKTNRLILPEEAFEVQDSVKPRREVFARLKEIMGRLDSVARAEVSNALPVMQRIYGYFDSDEIEEEDVFQLATKAKDFYTEINNAMLPIAFYQTDAVKKAAKQIAKAINDIGEVIDEEDSLTIIMAFSSDPLSDLQPLSDLFNRLEEDFAKVDKQLEIRRSALGDVIGSDGQSGKYAEEKAALAECFALLKMEVRE